MPPAPFWMAGRILRFFKVGRNRYFDRHPSVLGSVTPPPHLVEGVAVSVDDVADLAGD